MLYNMMQFLIETHDEYIKRLTGKLKTGEAASLKISSMNLFAREDTPIYEFLEEMKRADSRAEGSGAFRVIFDKAQANRTAVMPDGHYTLRLGFWDLYLWRKKMKASRIRKKTQKDFASILVDLPPRYREIKALPGFWRKFMSGHLFQFLAAMHIKVAVVQDYDGVISTSIANGELSSESRQNNLALTLPNDRLAAEFALEMIDPATEIGYRNYAVQEIVPKIRLVADFGNYGSPGEISKIHQLAESMINPSRESKYKDGRMQNIAPTNIILVSQYVPSGTLLKSLRLTATPKGRGAEGGGFGARVVVPLQPKRDYRRRGTGFRVLFANFTRHRGKHIITFDRPMPSHVKCLLARYDDGSVSMIFGSDNFDSTADSFYRNTELSLHVDRVFPGEDGYGMVVAMLGKLVETREIPKAEMEKFLG